MFTPGSTRECHTVSILQDDDCEQPLEDFFADLAYVSGIQPININISTTRVIIDDSGEPECGKYNSMNHTLSHILYCTQRPHPITNCCVEYTGMHESAMVSLECTRKLMDD